MKITQVRNATLRIDFGGKRFLVDPYLAVKGAYPALPGTASGDRRNPLVELTVPMSEILDVDAVIVTHTHLDHWDEAAKNLIPKGMLVLVQNEMDAAAIQAAGFSNTRILTDNTTFDGITLIKTPGRHGSDEAYAAIRDRLGEVCGVVFRHLDEKTIYLAGDTIWNGYVEDNLRTHKPDVIVLNCGDAQIIGLGSIIMGKEDVYKVHRAALGAILVASHMEAVNHGMLSRRELREFIAEKGMTPRVLVPDDGEAVSF
ncbi:MBL fold metallo-hydrolase [Microvirga makkahensis]|uniref:MBL fold metallo-hydrolase n=1 Tax=Microvirga makkahensis TaxID=1128670 RepID=A0A7X3SR42_9HYPH|nr:MBL fold metallo-hydrolase [Microvirga makkahensis]MXQ13938.1 MBL fold metallo-hydrolase [Microvirga makkahensis]